LRLLLGVLALACLLVGLLYLNSSLHAWWASWGPPGDADPWRARAWRHGLVALTLLATSGLASRAWWCRLREE
jgi:hypothetical protein